MRPVRYAFVSVNTFSVAIVSWKTNAIIKPTAISHPQFVISHRKHFIRHSNGRPFDTQYADRG